MRYILGLSAYQQNSAAVLIDNNGNIINASQEQHRTGMIGDIGWPNQSRAWCYRNAEANGINFSITAEECNSIREAFYENSTLKFSRRIWNNPRKVRQFASEYFYQLWFTATYKIPHHTSHALSGIGTSPFESGVYLVVDGLGEWETTSWGTFTEKSLKKEVSIKYPHSLCLLYSAFTRWLGFIPQRDEQLMMAASQYGTPRFVYKIYNDFIYITDGEFRLKKNIQGGIEQYWGSEVPANEWLDWCASIQRVFEEVLVNIVQGIQNKHGNNVNIVYGGEAATNSIANMKIVEKCNLNNLWIASDPTDAGAALGAAIGLRQIDVHSCKVNWSTPFLGVDIDNGSNPTLDLIRYISGRLEDGKVIAWIQGNEEFSPHTLGHRSLICDPKNPESFKKICDIQGIAGINYPAVAIMEEWLNSYFRARSTHLYEFGHIAATIRDQNNLPGYDIARVQTVPKSTDSFRRLLEHWNNSSGTAMLINMDFAQRGKARVSSRNEAMKIFLGTPIDVLVIGNEVYLKEEKTGLTEDGRPLVVTTRIDFDAGADTIVKGRF